MEVVNDSFADAPLSVAEIRSDKSANGADWTPRDALIATLREIDSGKLKPDALVIAMREPTTDPGASITTFKNATPDALVAYGLMVDTILKLARTGER
jgi:hypothetical protein